MAMQVDRLIVGVWVRMSQKLSLLFITMTAMK